MKKAILFVVLASSFTISQAQTKFGAKVGANIATLSGSDAEDAKSKIGLILGVFADVPLAETFSFKPEVVFSSQGAKANGTSGDDFKLNLSYINVPLLGKYNTSSGFFAQTGPQIGFLAAAKAKGGGSDVDVKEFYKKTDFSWAFGIGYEMLESGFGIDGRYNLGLSKVPDDGSKVKNSVFQITIFKTFGSATASHKK